MTTDQRLQTLESQISLTMTKSAAQTLLDQVSAIRLDHANSITTLQTQVADLQTRLNDALARLAAAGY